MSRVLKYKRKVSIAFEDSEYEFVFQQAHKRLITTSELIRRAVLQYLKEPK